MAELIFFVVIGLTQFLLGYYRGKLAVRREYKVWHSPDDEPMRGHTILIENNSLVKYFCSGIDDYENWAFFKADWAVIRWAYTSDLEKLGSVK